MRYRIKIKKQAKKKLLSLAGNVRIALVEKITALGDNPDDPSLDIKKMAGQSLYRLRVGRWRIIYDRQDEIRLVAIEKIGARGDVYK